MVQCRIESTKATYAAKIFHTNDTYFKESFTKEAETLAQLNHPNLVSLIGIHESEEEFIILTDLYDASLKQVLQDRRSISEPEMVQWCIQILEGLAYIHSKHIAHRDLKVNLMYFYTDPFFFSVPIFWFSSLSSQKSTVFILQTLVYPKLQAL